MQQLGANTIRIYNLSPDLNHDECVSIFNAVCLSRSERLPHIVQDARAVECRKTDKRTRPAST